jgi:hypothetical protein
MSKEKVIEIKIIYVSYIATKGNLNDGRFVFDCRIFL